MKIINNDCQKQLEKIKDNSIDCVITDPPYRYLKKKEGSHESRIDANFNREKVFSELYRVLKNNSFISIFGRGTELCKDVVCMEKLGFKFKEEIVWDKKCASNMTLDLYRQHELCFILQKGQAKLNKIYIDYVDYCIDNNQMYRLKRHINDIRALLNEKNIDKLIKYFETGELIYNRSNKNNFFITTNVRYSLDRHLDALNRLCKGTLLRSIIKVSKDKNYTVPTQKPVELLKRLVELTSNENDIILDPFCGSGSLGIACLETNRDFYLIEKYKEYYEIAKKNIKNYANNNLFCKKKHLTVKNM